MRCGWWIILLTIAHAALAREPWLSSRIVGSPDPPPPYITERVFPNLKFREPVELTAMPGTDRLVLVEREAKIYSFPNRTAVEKPDLFADMKDLDREIRETYSIAFHPGFLTNRYIFVFYIYKAELPEGTHISRFKVTDTNPPRIDFSTEKLIITWLSGGHNGGCIRFGSDGFMYLSIGDATAPSPPDILDTGQDLSDLLGSIVRIDVDREDSGKPYRIPPDNPFINTPRARPEIWAYGFRNPWRMSFDPSTGNLWVGDVGWELWEMIYRVERGGNYGWSLMEGNHVVRPGSKRGPTPILPPIIEHPHSEAASITGGYVYRGKRFSELKGAYIYGDYETGKIWELWHDGRRVTKSRELTDTPFKIISFAEDHEGELHILDYAGTLHRLVRNPAAGKPSEFPRKLSETGLFTSVRDHKLAPGVAPFGITADLWSDNAVAARMLALPGNSVVYTTNSHWEFPSNAVLAKTYTLDERKIETQLLHFNGESWGAYSYRWNDDQSDAALVPASGDQAVIGKQTWRFFSRAECLRCHNPWCHTALAFTPLQLRESMPEHGAVLKDKRKKLVNPYDAAADFDARARSWLHVNCSHCHRENAGGAVVSFMNYESPLEKCRLVDAKPTQGDFGITDAKIIAPGDPFGSILLYRISKCGTGKMPYLGANLADERGLKLIREWIADMPGGSRTKTLGAVSSALALAHEFSDLPAEERQKVLAHAKKAPNPLVRELFERFLPEEERRKILGSNIDPQSILALKGDATRGRQLFFQEGGVQCSTCHRINGVGREFGPDLSQISRKYDRAQLLEHILQPSKVIDPQFAAVLVETSDDLYSGYIVRRTEKDLALRVAGGEEKTFPESQIKRVGPQQISLMPEGLLQGLTAPEAADLLEFLRGLR
jgi:putative heme-binding domain-containing protein